MEQTVSRTKKASNMIGILLFMYILTGILLLIISFLLYKFDISEGAVNIGIILTYVLSGFAGGIFAGKKMKSQRFLWGMLAGVLYFAILILVSALMKNNVTENMDHILLTIILCIASSTIGGMVS